jgi:hypothetical protein
MASGGINDWHGGRRSPARSNGVGRARGKARLCEMRQGSECGCGRCSKMSWGAWAGDVAGDLGVRAQVRVFWSTAGAGKAELTGRSHGTAKERERARRG